VNVMHHHRLNNWDEMLNYFKTIKA
jgi:hypothetical protein